MRSNTAAALVAALGACALSACQGAADVAPLDSANAVIVWSAQADQTALTKWDGQSIAGMPILLKDNIETRDMPTTAGSLALLANMPGRDAPLVDRLRRSGAVILGKTNLSEWANIRSSESISGWSAVGGQTLNPYDPTRTPCGSSSGSGAAVAIGLAPVAIGTETDGSITCPASVNGIVGFKPTVGLVSRTHIVPISHSQDTAGPMATTVRNAALALNAIAGSDPQDPATQEADARKRDYVARLDSGSLRGARIGVMRFLKNYSPETQAVFEANLQALRNAGAVLVDLNEGPDGRAIGEAEFEVLLYELKHDLNLYLASTRPDQVSTRSLEDVIAFNAREPGETVIFGQDIFEQSQAKGGLDTPAYAEARAVSLRLAGPEGIDKLLQAHQLGALIAPTTSRAWTNDPQDDDDMQGSASRLAAVAGYPHLTVPMGFDRGMPVGLSFIGAKWADADILSLGYAFEQATKARRAPVRP
ncbi:hypothetical protein LTR94_024021 [Friedmanniomyces endolithicus]|nr:hypothetical protein LTR94_024021 [Friedmanniomyces endolithicus]